jgi:hypothetical protein
MTFSIVHWNTWDNSFVFQYARGRYYKPLSAQGAQMGRHIDF